MRRSSTWVWMGLGLCVAACDDGGAMQDRACDGATCEGEGSARSGADGGPTASGGGSHVGSDPMPTSLDGSSTHADGDAATSEPAQECEHTSDCESAALSECEMPACVDGLCDMGHAEPGTLLEDGEAGDCRRPQCDRGGVATSADDDDDLPEDDGNPCTAESCNAGSARHLPEPSGTACAADGGAYCDGLGACVECVLPAHCESGVCQNGACRPEPCGNDELDEGETDVDCGGDCGGCGPSQACLEDGDCVGLQCELGVCVPNCDDAVLNQGESAVDCGEVCTGKPCANGLGCGGHADCDSTFCTPDTQHCATPSCADGYRNGTETAVDCDGVTEGETCPECPIPCMDNWQCDHGGGLCYDGHCVDDVNGCTQANALDYTHMVESSQTTPITIEFGDTHGTSYAPRCIKVTMGSAVEFVGSFASHPLLGGIVVGGVKHPATTGPFTTMTDTGTSHGFAMDDCASYPFYCANHGGSGMNGAVIVLLP